ncbi:MAG: single-stranded-DNA-specific exonuclease RecJ [Oscillospiraceae bacterium]|nr:single-stranded-DNA-specific exonuclease RecJ [Oscillospiraceae bacterium]
MKKWNIKKADENAVRELLNDESLKTAVFDELLSREPDSGILRSNFQDSTLISLLVPVLVSRGFCSTESIGEKFSAECLSDPFLIRDMEKAVEKINSAIDESVKICIYGDYDCDGIMSTVILYTFLSQAGADVIYYIPERSEGYGLNCDAVRKIADMGTKLIITVDNGISAVKEAELIYELGMELVITDHHQPPEILPKAEAVIDPHRKDCMSPFKNLCGAGVVLKLVSALDGGNYEIPLEQFADLTALATVADVVDLSGENRYIVCRGMNFIEQTDRTGLTALLEVSGLLGKKINSTSMAFMLSPRINASGRFGSPKTAVNLLLSENEEEAHSIAQELNSLNENRKKAELIITDEICQLVNSDRSLASKRVLFFCGKDWNHGVIGIVASKIEELYGKPCFIASESNGEIRGSARAFGEFSVFKALNYCEECLEKFGGHQGAGGFTIKSGMTDKFDSMLQEYAFINHREMPVFSYNIDYVIKPDEMTLRGIKGLDFIEPCGQGNDKPIFLINGATVEEISPMGAGKHTMLRLNYGGKKLYAKIFRKPPEKTGILVNQNYSFAVNLEINHFNNRDSVNILVIDYRRQGINQNKIINAHHIYESFLRDEELPQNYYNSMYPERDEVALIYRKIAESGTDTDMLYSQIFSEKLNYCKFLVAIEALAELKLIDYIYSEKKVKRLKADGKVNLETAPILIKLREKTGR